MTRFHKRYDAQPKPVQRFVYTLNTKIFSPYNWKMTHILTLIASSIPVTASHLQVVQAFVESARIGQNGEPLWLKPHHAADLPIANGVTMEQMRELRALLAADKIDIVCTPAENRQKKLLLADMDSTIITTETLDELAARAGLKDKITTITTQAMNGKLDFHSALKERVALLEGLPVSALEETLTDTEISQGAEALIKTMNQNGGKCVLVSGGFTFFTEAIANRLGFAQHHGNTLDVRDGVLVGTVAEPILDRHAKLTLLEEYTAKHSLTLEDTVAVGDGANDLAMLTKAGLGIGYRPKPIVEDTLLNILKYADLTGVLYAQGMKKV